MNLSRSLRLEYAERNIRVNARCPRCIETPILIRMLLCVER
ncbi:hypothetical protein [Oceanobacillus chungangensis]|nr:hypothetical protein [Oceanobacillus chungangensis]